MLAGFSLCGMSAQSTLPPTQPTTLPSVAPLSGTAPQMDAATRARRAEVQYASGLLAVNANNSSLNQILRDIARMTGMKITGGVRDEHVFGHYGPAAPEIILGTLIDKNSTNMLLRQSSSAEPQELILTPRNGGPSPPNPNAPGFEDSSDEDSDRPQPPARTGPAPPIGLPGDAQAPINNPSSPTSVPPSVPPPANNVNGNPLNVTPTASQLPTTNSVSTDTIPTPSTTPPSSGIVDTPNPPDPGTVNPASPNGVKTPEEIYQQLQKMRQQQKKTPQG